MLFKKRYHKNHDSWIYIYSWHMVWLKTITITNNISFISKNYTFASRAPGGFFCGFQNKDDYK